MCLVTVTYEIQRNALGQILAKAAEQACDLDARQLVSQALVELGMPCPWAIDYVQSIQHAQEPSMFRVDANFPLPEKPRSPLRASVHVMLDPSTAKLLGFMAEKAPNWLKDQQLDDRYPKLSQGQVCALGMGCAQPAESPMREQLNASWDVIHFTAEFLSL